MKKMFKMVVSLFLVAAISCVDFSPLFAAEFEISAADVQVSTISYKEMEGLYVPDWISRSFDVTVKSKKKKIIVMIEVKDSSGGVAYKKKASFATSRLDNLWPQSDLEYTLPLWFLKMFPYTKVDFIQEGNSWVKYVYVPCYKNKKAQKKGKHQVAKLGKFYGTNNWTVKTYDKGDKLDIPASAIGFKW